MNTSEFAPNSQQQEALYDALDNLGHSTYSFTQYTKVQMSEDGYIFWVKGTNTISVKGAMHVATEREQEIDDTISMNSVILDSQSEITEFNQTSPTTMWVGDITAPGGVSVKIAFQRRGPFFANAGVYHYAGFAVFPPFGPQIVDSTSALPAQPIVSNSLPIWIGFSTPEIPIYPSFLVPENAAPPYIAAHIDPAQTSQLQPVPLAVWSTANPDPTQPGFYDLATSQLMHDHVEMICYGLNNLQAWTIVYKLMQDDSDTFGFMSLPVIRDEKRTQPEIMAIAQKKVFEFDVSYYMEAADVIARRLITSATMSVGTVS